MMKNRLHSIIKKCELFDHPEWCGWFQPADIIRLMDSGMIRIDKFHEVDVQKARDDKARGYCNPRWFYFYPNTEFIELHRGLKR